MTFKNANKFRNDFQDQVIGKTLQLDETSKGKILSVKVIPPFVNVTDLYRFTLADEMQYKDQDVNAVAIVDLGYLPTAVFVKLKKVLEDFNIPFDLKNYED